MSQEEKGTSPQTADEIVAEMMAQAAAQAKRRADTQDAAKRILALVAEVLSAEEVLEKSWWQVSKNNREVTRADFEAASKVVDTRKRVATMKEEIDALRKGDGSPEYAAALKVALTFEMIRASAEPSEETVRQFAKKIADLAHLNVMDSQEAKKANGGKYPFGAAVYKELCLVYAGEERQSGASRGLVKEFRNLVDRHYAAVKAAGLAEFAALEDDENASDDLQAMAHGKVGKYRLHLPEYEGKKAGCAIVEVRHHSSSGKLEVWAKDGAGSLASVRKYAEMRLSLPVKKQEGEEVIASRHFGWAPNYMSPERRADAENFLKVLQLSLRIFNENGRDVVALSADDAERAAEEAKIDAALEAAERHIAEGAKLIAEADQAPVAEEANG